MFFFFVGGLEQQARQVLKSGVGRCINCGSRADLVEYEKVLKLFFVPVWRWPGKDPLLHCNNCKLFFPQDLSFPPPKIDSSSAAVFVTSLLSPSSGSAPFVALLSKIFPFGEEP
ncbi:hypothetical protein ERO13_A06G045000v2 [Gossypium hirsutum]|uniref:Zinc-ribbon 15 domain-containing protein n=1 Tax=Gossypium tomentosum TaxID=34277 RepID=A0A5D2Q0F9_GOSTO|nr:hypothetical protein ERO13_A06G045000v2 [Gossypium hirsutum]TYI21672.1 hypothetical protein ES332_A06G053800v1 [Gossypium tomentosum]